MLLYVGEVRCFSLLLCTFEIEMMLFFNSALDGSADNDTELLTIEGTRDAGIDKHSSCIPLAAG